MSDDQTKHMFGDSSRAVSRVMLQHTSRITPEAAYLPRDAFVKVVASNRGHPKEYRKAQVHPTVYVNALESGLQVCPVEVTNNECVVILTGGTPEAAVAPIALGLKNVLYVAGDDNEFDMMQIPLVSEEREFSLDYHAYPYPHERSIVGVTGVVGSYGLVSSESVAAKPNIVLLRYSSCSFVNPYAHERNLVCVTGVV